MLLTVHCPSCRRPCCVAESALGQRVRCPACDSPFLCGTLSPPSLETRPVPDEEPPAPVRASAPTRAAGAQAGPGIHFRCPRCSRPLEAPQRDAGQKVHCPDCDQRLQFPQPAAPPAAVAPPPAEAPQEEAIPEAELVPTPRKRRAAEVRREHCLECGRDVSDRRQVQTCPDCGSLFCSSGCFREHRHHAHPRR